MGSYVYETSFIYFGNDLVELKIDPETGFFRDILSKATHIHHKASENSGIWPFGLRLGSAQQPDLLRIEIAAKGLHPQKMRHQVYSEGNFKTLETVYEDLKTTGGASTGIKLTVHISLKEDADYYLIRGKLENSGKYAVTNFFSGGAELVADKSREQEKLALFGWDYGTIWSNPHSFFVERETFGYPIFGSSCALDAGWIDLYGERGGIGIGYVNRQGLTMHFNVQRQGQGMNLNWQLFNLMHEKMAAASVGGIYPLKPGEEFTTDYWILAPHAGDWHRMADIYRREYEEAFKGDFLTWEETHETAKKVDLQTGYQILDVRDMIPGEITFNKFSDAPLHVNKFIDNTGVLPENLLVYVGGHSIHWCLYMPDFFPCCPEGGGDEGCKKMVADLREMGVEAILFYAHLFYNHPKANDYVAEADTGYDHQNVIWKEIGNVACVDCDQWIDLWKTKYIPGYDEVGVSGVVLDQGPTQYLVCTREGHRHGTNAVGMLGAHVRGVSDLIRAFKEGYRNRKPFFWTEVGSDIQTRLVDIWSCSSRRGSYARGGECVREIGRYTFPYRLCVDAAATTPSEVNDTLVNGFILGAWMSTHGLREDLVQAVRRFVKVRRELRQAKAHGFPHGYRHALGLKVGNPNLVARAYRGDEGITVLYCAKEDVEATLAVDKDALGFPGKDIETIHVNLKKDEVGYRIITA